jgi:carboxymethylenebutenolidase
MRDTTMLCETVSIVGHGGDLIPAYLARPLGPGPFASVVVIHYAPGWDDTIKETTRSFGARGYIAICPNLHHRELPFGDPAQQAALVSEAGRVPDDRCLADFAGARAYVDALPTSSGKVGVIGFCSGGRQALMIGCRFPVDTVVDCYGGRVILATSDLSERQPVAVIDMIHDLRAPLLGLFGGDDDQPSPAQVAEIDAVLREHGKVFEFTIYEGAGHGFMSVDRPNYSVSAARDAWLRIWAWLAFHLTDAEALPKHL